MNNIQIENYIKNNQKLRSINTKVFSPTSLPQKKIKIGANKIIGIIFNLCEGKKIF